MKPLVLVFVMMTALPVAAQTTDQLRPHGLRPESMTPIPERARTPLTPDALQTRSPSGREEPAATATTLPPNSVSFQGTALTLTTAHCNKHVESFGDQPVTVTIAANMPTTQNSSCDVSLVQWGNGVVSVVAGQGVAFVPGPFGFTKTAGQGAEITIHYARDPAGNRIYSIWGMGAK